MPKSPEKFDFSSIEDQKSFEQLSQIEQEKIIEESHCEAIKKEVDDLLESAKNQEKLPREYVRKICKLVIPILLEKYNVAPEIEKMLKQRLSNNLYVKTSSLLEALPDHEIRGKKILDLGCGSTGGTYEAENLNEEREFEPWFSRFLNELGSKVIGVDIGNLDREPYEHFSTNLVVKDSLDMIDDSVIDAVFTSSLYDSPELEKHLKPNKMEDEIKKNLYPQIKRVLKSGGNLVEYNPIGTKILKKEEL